MTNRSKRIGTDWEGKCRDMLKRVFADTERAPQWGSADKGDLVNTGPFVVECKADKSFALSTWLNEARVEAQNAGRPFPVVFIKRPRHRAEQGYALMQIDDFINLMERSGL